MSGALSELYRTPLILGQSGIRGALAGVLPAAQTEDGSGTTLALPGIATGTYGGIDALVNAVARRTTGADVHLPGGQWAGDVYNRTMKLAGDYVPEIVTPAGGYEEAVNRVGEVAGSMVSPLPGGGIATGIGKAGKIAQGLGVPASAAGKATSVAEGVAKYIVPTSDQIKANVPIAGGLTAVAEGGDAALGLGRYKDQPAKEDTQTGPHIVVRGEEPTTGPSIVVRGEETPGVTRVNPTGPSIVVRGEENAPPTTTGSGVALRAPTYDTASEKPSGWTTGEGLAVAALGIASIALAPKMRGAATAIADKILSTTAEERYLQKGAEFNKAVDARDVGSTEPLPKTAPLPGTANTWATRLKTWGVDSAAQLKETIKAASASPQLAMQRIAEWAGVQDRAYGHESAATMETGIIPGSKVRVPEQLAFGRRVAAADPAVVDLAKTAIIAKDELETRVINGRSGKGAYKFANKSDADLQAEYAAGMAHPEAAAMIDHYKTSQQRYAEYMYEQGFIDKATFVKITRDRQHHVPEVNAEGGLMHSFGERDITPGTGTRTINPIADDPFRALPQQQHALILDVKRNNIIRDLTEMMEQWQALDPRHPKLITDRTTGPGGTTAPQKIEGQVISVRNRNGTVFKDVNDPNLFHAMANDNTARQLMNNWSLVRQFMQGAVTGPTAMVMGKMFAPLNALRNSIQIGITGHPDLNRGLLDMTMKKISGDRFGYAGWDPTTTLGAFASGGIDMASTLAHGMSEIIRSENPIGRVLQTLMGPKFATDAANWLEQKWANSNAAEMRAKGLAGSSVGLGGDRVTRTWSGAVRTPLDRTVPEYYSPMVRSAYGPMKPVLSGSIKLKSLIDDLFNNIADGTESYLNRINKGGLNKRMSKDMKTQEIRGAFGDLGARGAGAIPRFMAQTMPYGNVTLQDIARTHRAFVENPIGATVGLANTVAVAAAGSLFTAAMYGQSHLDYLEQHQSNMSRNRNIILFHNENPEIHTEISLPQSISWAYAMATDMLATFYGGYNMHDNEDVATRTINALGDVFKHKMTASTERSILQGIGQTFDPLIGMPVGGELVANAVGVDMRPSVYGAVKSLAEGGGITELIKSQSAPITTQKSVPNQRVGSDNTANADGGVAQAMVSTVAGLLATTISMYANYHRRSGYGPEIQQQGVFEDWKQQAKDLNPWGNLVWGNAIRSTVRSPLEESVEAAKPNIMATAGASGEIRNEGFTRARGVPILGGAGDSKIPTDPLMRDLYFTTSEFGRIYNHYQPDITDIKKQIEDNNKSGMMPEAVRSMHNRLVDQLQEKYRRMDGIINDLNHALTQKVGHEVDIRAINWGKGSEQFN